MAEPLGGRAQHKWLDNWMHFCQKRLIQPLENEQVFRKVSCKKSTADLSLHSRHTTWFPPLMCSTMISSATLRCMQSGSHHRLNCWGCLILDFELPQTVSSPRSYINKPEAKLSIPIKINIGLLLRIFL